MGGRALGPGPLNFAQVIHVERSVTPVIFAIFHRRLCVFKNTIIRLQIQKKKYGSLLVNSDS